MHREKSFIVLQINLALDILLTLVGFVLAYWIKTDLLPLQYQALAPVESYGWMVLLYLILMIASLYLSGFYTFGRTMTYTDLLVGVAKSVTLAAMILVFLLFVSKTQTVSRLLVFIYALVSLALVFSGKAAIKFVGDRLRTRGYNSINALVCGSGELARAVIEDLRRNQYLGYKIVGCVDVDPERLNTEVAGVRVVGTTDMLGELLNELSIDEVFFAIPSHLVRDMDRLVYSCEEVGVRANIVWDLYKPSIAKTVVRDFLDMPVLTFTATPMQTGQLMIKRLIDLAGSALGLILLSPLFLLITVLIKTTSPGPVLFVQRRTGLNGRPFEMYKFRTMVADAETRLGEVKHLNEMDGPVFKVRDDPRVTRLGRFLRRTSIDELPQLLNVFKGEMSLVGPRPPLHTEVGQYERWQRRRLSMKPGITCFWQINGRNEVDFEEWMRLDLRYIDNWSLKLDFKILLKTIPTVLLQRGAS